MSIVEFDVGGLPPALLESEGLIFTNGKADKARRGKPPIDADE